MKSFNVLTQLVYHFVCSRDYYITHYSTINSFLNKDQSHSKIYFITLNYYLLQY